MPSAFSHDIAILDSLSPRKVFALLKKKGGPSFLIIDAAFSRGSIPALTQSAAYTAFVQAMEKGDYEARLLNVTFPGDCMDPLGFGACEPFQRPSLVVARDQTSFEGIAQKSAHGMTYKGIHCGFWPSNNLASNYEVRRGWVEKCGRALAPFFQSARP